MKIMEFLGDLSAQELQAIAKGKISSELRHSLENEGIKMSDRELIAAAKAAQEYFKKSGDKHQQIAAEASAEAAQAAAEAAAEVAPDQEQAPAPGEAPRDQVNAPEVAGIRF